MLITKSNSRQQSSDDYQIVEQALNYLDRNYLNQPSLEDIAAHVGLSEFHFQRMFSRWVGISPKRFLQFLTKEHARELLDHSASVLEAAYQSGLSSPGRLHDLFITFDAVTPGEYKLHGKGLKINYGFHPSPFGECMLAVTERGICGLAFELHGNRLDPVDDLRKRWKNAEIVEKSESTAIIADQIFSSNKHDNSKDLKLFINGTNFQIKVWEALLHIPLGTMVTYEEIAAYLGNPRAARAVGQAVASNPIAYIIPCHRVIRKIGEFGGYRWGTARKKAILGWEMAANLSSGAVYQDA
jgi:AraC family transcriptional regulator, regulatory protein of adaptative response / methylated-DNA-[protein]-cysteine methyltransferase